MIGYLQRAFALTAAVVVCAFFAGTASAASSIGFIWEASGTPTITVSSVVQETYKGQFVVSGDATGIGAFSVSLQFNNELNITMPGEDRTGGPLGIPPFPPILPVGGLNGDGQPDLPCRNCGPGGREQTANLPGGGNFFTTLSPGYNENQIESEPAIGGGPIMPIQPAVVGLLGSFDLSTGGSGLKNGTRTIGSVFFTTVPSLVRNGNIDVRVVLAGGSDGVFAPNGTNISSLVTLGTAFVNTTLDTVPEPGTGILLLAGLGGLARYARRSRRA